MTSSSVPRAEERAPVHRRRRGVVQEARRAGQEVWQAGERHLSVLAERDLLVGLERLQPHADANLVTSLRHRQIVGHGEQVASDVQVAAVVAARQPQLGLWIGRLAPANHHRADREPRQEARDAGSRRARRGLAREEISRAREAEAGRVEQRRREHVRFLHAEHLLSQAQQVRAERIERRGGVGVAVVKGVDRVRANLLLENT